ncbi:hypothetical protein Tco_0909059 [Tanacetum coccineum]|uniref:Uncharacterized protein n=1 Tax=Tanacetum coccineum TaxID=301880 RepID=A0ABQ5CVC4_9ASTR
MLATPKLRINNHNVLGMAASKSSDLTYKVVQKDISSRNPSSFSGLQQPLFVSTWSKYVFNANHDACVTKFLKEILTGHRFSPNKSSAMDEKTSHRSCLRWKPTSRIFNTISLRWVPTGKIFTSSTTKVTSEPLNGSNEDITNLHECEQTRNVSASTLNLSEDNTSGPVLKEKKSVHFNVLYLQKKRNLLVYDHSHQQFSYFPMFIQSTSGSTTRGKPSSLTPYFTSKKDYDICFNHCLMNTFSLHQVLYLLGFPMQLHYLLLIPRTFNKHTIVRVRLRPSASTSPITQEIQSLVIHQGVEEQIQGIQNA